jgi:hypothetical protein
MTSNRPVRWPTDTIKQRAPSLSAASKRPANASAFARSTSTGVPSADIVFLQSDKGAALSDDLDDTRSAFVHERHGPGASHVARHDLIDAEARPCDELSHRPIQMTAATDALPQRRADPDLEHTASAVWSTRLRYSVNVDCRIRLQSSVLAAFHCTAGVLPLVKSSKERPGVSYAECSQRERRTGARLLGLSTAVRDDRFGECSQLFDAALHRGERNPDRARNMTGDEAVFVTNVHNSHRTL